MQGRLFTENFLLEGIKDCTEWTELSEEHLSSFRNHLQALYEDFPTKGSPNEENTKERLIWPVLKLLGWPDILREEALAKKGRSDVPDGLLFLRDEDRRQAEEEKSSEKRFRHGVSILEAKRWNLSLDRAASKSSKRGAPAAQIISYLDRARVFSERAVLWGILTNGRIWRLYYQDAKSQIEEYFEVDLAEILGLEGFNSELLAEERHNPNHWLKLFLLMFRRLAFEKGKDGRSLHQFALDEGQYWEVKVRESLSETVFQNVFPRLIRLLHAADKEAPRPLTTDYLQDLRDAALTLLYRLLFALYAEDRDLLSPNDPAYDDYGLRHKVREDVAKRLDAGDVLSERSDSYYHHCQTLFQIIDKGDGAIGVPPYNGGLFQEERSPILERVKLSDGAFGPIVDLLSRRTEDGELRWINYRDLSVRELGAIYERLLEQEPVADGDGVSIRPTIFARKGSGSYYTPDNLVQLIIEKSVGPLVEEKLTNFEQAAAKLKSDRRTKSDRRVKLETLDPATQILDLKICDPAMGSGHFLVSLVDFLADATLKAMETSASVADWADYQSPLAPRIEEIRTRITEQAFKNNWHIKDNQLEDKNIVRRFVLKRCVYGVDKNPMAVELAKVSLWLHSFTAGAPLSFLDHHLRCGDSLFGEWIRPFLDELHKRGDMFVDRFVTQARQTVTGMTEIESLSDADIAEAERSASLFTAIEEDTARVRAFLDIRQACRWLGKDGSKAWNALLDGLFGDPVSAVELAAAVPQKLKAPKQSKETTSAKKTLLEAKQLIDEEKFLHWQVSFPGIWDNWQSAEPQGGFDAVIGNPPWDRMKMQEVEWFAERAPEIAKQGRAADRKKMIADLKREGSPLFAQYEKARDRAEIAMQRARKDGHFPLLSKGDINIYSLFVERAQALINPHGIAGLLVPSGIASDKTASDFFKSVSTSGRVMSLFDFENKKIFFPDVHASFKFCVFVVGGKDNIDNATECAFFLHSVDTIEDKERCFYLSSRDFTLVNPNTGTAPIFRTRRDADITTSIYRRVPVLVDRSGDTPQQTWPVKYVRMFDMTNDSDKFWTRERLQQEGAYPIRGNKWKKGDDEFVPLYVGRMIHQFDHRASSVRTNEENVHNAALSEAVTNTEKEDPNYLPQPQYWVNNEEIDWLSKLQYAFAFRDIARSTDERTAIGTVIPKYGVGNTLPIVMAPSAEIISNFTAVFSSFVFDYVCRQKVQSTHLNWYLVEQLPFVTLSICELPGTPNVQNLVTNTLLQLVFTANDLAEFAIDFEFDGPPFRWDPDERTHLRARLDALFFLLYGVTDRDDVRHIMSTFPIVRRNDEKEFGFYRTQELILAYMNALEAGDTETIVDVDALQRQQKT